jgi:hypothetical protein
LTGLLSHGANKLGNVDFRTTELRKFRDQARAMAIKAAKEKATALCRELDVKCGKPLSINTEEYGGYFGLRNSNAYANGVQNLRMVSEGGSDLGAETLSLGQISVSATVNASFRIE